MFRSPLDPNWVTGFVDGEGCFYVGFSANSAFNTGIEVRPSFSIGQGSSSRNVMEDLLNTLIPPKPAYG